MTEEINKGCEFQSDCIEYKDISYLKVMPICAIHELSIACHDKVNKCKYYKLYKQHKRLEQENKELKEWKDKVIKLFESACRCKYLNEETDICSYTNKKCININKCVYKYQELSSAYRSALEEIREIITSDNSMIIDKKVYFELQCGEPVTLKLQKIYSRINEVLGNENN